MTKTMMATMMILKDVDRAVRFGPDSESDRLHVSVDVEKHDEETEHVWTRLLQPCAEFHRQKRQRRE